MLVDICCANSRFQPEKGKIVLACPVIFLVITHSYDLGLANENLLLKAAEMGIGTLVMGIRDEKKLHEILSIPEEQMVVSVIGVGYGTVSPDMPKRKSVEDVAVIC